jgi:hypothetical protein
MIGTLSGASAGAQNATIVVHARELEVARASEDPLASGYVRADYDRPELRWQLAEGELDLFENGTIRLRESPES